MAKESTQATEGNTASEDRGAKAVSKEASIEVQDIHLVREGEEGEGDAVVYVKMKGKWYEAIRERIGGNFSHFISAYGLASLDKPTDWSVEEQPNENK